QWRGESALRRDQGVGARRWSWAQDLALAGVPMLVWEVWSLVAWLADGPYLITEFRDSGSMSWYAARVLEVVVLIACVAAIAWLVHGCRRQRRIMTFDVMFCIACVSIFWIDLGANFFVPVWLPSSNFVGINNVCGHIPFVVNPDCGRAPDPIIFSLGLYVCFPGLAMLTGRVLRRVRERRPDLTNPQLLSRVILAGILVVVVIEWGFALPMRLWSYAPGPLTLNMGDGFRYPLVEVLGAGVWMGLLLALWIFKDDRGQRVVERGLDGYPKAARTGITMLALYSLVQLITWGPGTAGLWVHGLYETAWPKLPAHIVNGICDVPEIEGTRYGPCPGSPGFRMPVRGSLLGQSP
ncbi:MAG: spirocyclase AveC family protein, partial [Actinomycetota bacterium]